MFDIAPSELLVVAVVALLVIGPKDLPKAMRFVGYWVGRARGVARQFRSGFDAMIREAELAELEKQWAAENERIMREHPGPAPAAIAHDAGSDAGAEQSRDPADIVVDNDIAADGGASREDAPPVMTPMPVVKDDAAADAAPNAQPAAGNKDAAA